MIAPDASVDLLRRAHRDAIRIFGAASAQVAELAAELQARVGETPRAAPVVSSSPLFGTWRACTDARSHYFLGTGTLCGGTASPTGASVRDPDLNKNRILVRYCARCRSINDRRWVNGGVIGSEARS